MDYLFLTYQPKQTKAGHEDLLDCHRWTPSLLTEIFFLNFSKTWSSFLTCNSVATIVKEAHQLPLPLMPLPPLITHWH